MRQILLLFLLGLAIEYGAALSGTRALTALGDFFGKQRDKDLCGRRFSTGRLEKQRSNTIQDLVIMRETKAVNAQKTQIVDFFEEFDEKKHGRLDAGERERAFYFPYLFGDPVVGEGRARKLNVGWVDIPKRPKRHQPRLAITGGMNGCATIVMSLKNDKKSLRVYHLQSPDNRDCDKDRWNRYIGKIKEFHPVDRVINSFSWEDYGLDEDTIKAVQQAKFSNAWEAVVLLHYNSDKQKWYYASQMNLWDAAPTVPKNDRYFDGTVYKTLYAQLENPSKPAAKYCT